MDNDVIDSKNLIVNARESQRLSYEMLFNESSFERDPEYPGTDASDSGQKEEESGAGEVREQITRLEEEWQQKLEEAKQSAYQQGLKEGQRQGKQEVTEQIKQQRLLVERAVSDVSGHMDSLLKDLKPKVATMVFEVAEKIIGLPVKSDRLKERVASELQRILGSLEKDIEVRITVAASDYEVVNSMVDDLTASGRVTLSSSAALNAGEYAVDTNNERIVKNYQEMLQDFRKKLALEDHEELEVE